MPTPREWVLEKQLEERAIGAEASSDREKCGVRRGVSPRRDGPGRSWAGRRGISPGALAAACCRPEAARGTRRPEAPEGAPQPPGVGVGVGGSEGAGWARGSAQGRPPALPPPALSEPRPRGGTLCTHRTPARPPRPPRAAPPAPPGRPPLPGQSAAPPSGFPRALGAAASPLRPGVCRGSRRRRTGDVSGAADTRTRTQRRCTRRYTHADTAAPQGCYLDERDRRPARGAGAWPWPWPGAPPGGRGVPAGPSGGEGRERSREPTSSGRSEPTPGQADLSFSDHRPHAREAAHTVDTHARAEGTHSAHRTPADTPLTCVHNTHTPLRGRCAHTQTLSVWFTLCSLHPVQDQVCRCRSPSSKTGGHGPSGLSSQIPLAAQVSCRAGVYSPASQNPKVIPTF
ncbi:uncharacterized protein [Vulpes vulpes]|uniref:Basic proline-rich protein-like n=1 Tax=Vulpes vulpes TaxID=9627 RepID=A0ABM4Z588_VULVU